MSNTPIPVPEPADLATGALDIQHDTDPARDHGNARRIPHLGHALLFFLIVGAFVFIASLVTLLSLKAWTREIALQHPVALIASQAIAYAMAFAVAVPVFPMLWQHSFLDGISWTWRAARLRWWKLVLFGAALAIVAELLEVVLKSSKGTDITQLMKTPAAGWVTVFFGILIAPVSEEIAFRGFLLPALATAYDWLSLERTPAGLARWRSTANHSRGALIF